MAKYRVTTPDRDVTIEADTFDLNGSFITFYNTKTLVPSNPNTYDQMAQFRDFVAAFSSNTVVSITKLGDE